MTQKVAFIGLGVMGFPMAGHLANAGFQVMVYNRTTSKAKSWCEQFPGNYAETPAEAAKQADIVCCCVGNDDDLRQVTVGPEGAFAGMQAGTIFIDHTTASAEVARELAQEAGNRQITFYDAPVSGGQAGAENGQLTIMIGGPKEQFEQILLLLNCYARFAKLMGEVGSGQLTKMVNQICIAGIVQGLSEGMHFAKSANLDVAAVIEVISKGAAQSWQMENRHQTMLAGEYNHGFAVDWMRKDLAIVFDEARRNHSHLPITAVVDQFYSEVQAMGGSRWDTSSLFAVLESKRFKH
ncbi:NAD(P)-dependent oxidoreductase [Spartinivicinus ruber]|uniref:NAD(P)-dependent oxidoreductase n=1 Tax=Spartinivicinus ruber TaxID=2683272 RepID=UPI0013D08494|nr:NAD(P)-dependent oxidoreductase [Spartinivicinus ruber]